jgi:uncharacterized protein
MGTTMTAETQPQPGNRAMALAGLALALFFALESIGHYIFPGDSMGALLGREAVFWLYALIAVLWVRYGEGLPLSSIGFRPPQWRTLWLALGGAVLLIATEAVHLAVIVPLFHLDANTMMEKREQLVGLPLWFRIMLVARAAVVEEILYRGFLIEKVRQVTGSTTLAFAVSVVTFTYAHLSGWGWVQLIPVFMAAMILAGLYVWRRDLPANIAAHFITDAVGLLLG